MNKEIFGKFLADTRRELGMTQQALAQQLHVTNTAVSKWERGLSYPDLDLFEPLAQALNLTMAELMACQRQTPDADDPTERNVRSLLDIVKDTTRRQRRNWLLLGVLLTATALLITVLVYHFTVLSVHEIRVSEVVGKQVEESGSYIFIEKDNSLLKLQCQDPALYNSIYANGRQYYRLEYRYNRNTCQGTLEICDSFESDSFLGTPLDTAGSSIGIDSILGVENAWNVCESIRRDPAKEGAYLYTYRFYRQDLIDPSKELTLVTIIDCRSFTLQDYDNDGVTELFVLTQYKNSPICIYDKENGMLVSRFVDEVPEDVFASLMLP